MRRISALLKICYCTKKSNAYTGQIILTLIYFSFQPVAEQKTEEVPAATTPEAEAAPAAETKEAAPAEGGEAAPAEAAPAEEASS